MLLMYDCYTAQKTLTLYQLQRHRVKQKARYTYIIVDLFRKPESNILGY